MGSKEIQTTTGMENQISMVPSLPQNNVGNRPPQNIDEGLNLVPMQNKTVLLHACMVCPALVQRESPPLRFLEFENFDYYAAAVRWAKYWDLRFNVFGPDRAFLPIADFTGNGAIPGDLIEYISTGVGVVLPPDDQQRPVFFIDRSRTPLECIHWSIENRQKLCFAMLQKIMLLSQNFVVIFFASSKPRFNPGMGEWFTDVLNYAFPMKLSAIYVACKSPKSRFKSFVATYIPVILKMINKNFRQVVVDIFVGDREELLRKLVLKGLNPADLPESVGGSWKYEVFEEWVRRQRGTSFDNSSQDSVISNGLKMLAVTMDESNRSGHLSQQKQGCDSKVSSTNERAVNKATTYQTTENTFLTEAVRNELKTMDTGKKLAYMEALNVAPHLETREATLDSFLVVENGNPKQAAERVVNYWRIRKAIFKDLSLRPLQQNIGGALNEVDLRTLKCGYIALLPNNKAGYSVLCCDASRLANDDEESRSRCLFYMLRVASQKSSGDASVSVLLIMNKLSFERTKDTMALAEILQIYPVKIASVHIIRQPARLGITFFEEKVVPTMQSIFRSVSAPIHIHSGTPTCDLRQELDSHGFDIKHLPRSLGGGWTYEDFLRWRDEQLKFEEASLSAHQTDSGGAKNVYLPSPKIEPTPLVTSQIPTAAIPLVLPSSFPIETYPTRFITVPQNSDQLQIQQSPPIAQHQELVQLNQRLDLQRLQLNQNCESQLMHLPLDQQHIISFHERLEQQQLLTIKQWEMLQVGRNVNAAQKTDPQHVLPAVAPSLADILNSLRMNQWNVK